MSHLSVTVRRAGTPDLEYFGCGVSVETDGEASVMDEDDGVQEIFDGGSWDELIITKMGEDE